MAAKATMGIDPGVRGGIAVLDQDGIPQRVVAIKPNMTQKALVEEVRGAVGVLISYGGDECFIEKVGYMPGDGGKGANTFGRIDGLLRGSVLAMAIKVVDVAPVIWQAKLGCLSGGNKGITKNMAEMMYQPTGIKITHNIADALLIARYGQLVRAGR